MLLRESVPGRLRRQQLRRLAVQALLFAYAAFVGFELAHRPKDEGLERTVCVLIVVLFLIGIARAWQLIGARDASLVGEVARTIGSRRRRPTRTTDPFHRQPAAAGRRRPGGRAGRVDRCA